MSFVGGHTQASIAQELEVSQSKVHRLISHAQTRGYVTIRVHGGSDRLLELEAQIKDAFGLDRCTICSGGLPDHIDEQTLIASVGETAGQYLASLLDNKSITRIGAGMGRTMSAAIEAMPDTPRADLKIVAITGSLSRKLSANPLDVVLRLQHKTGGEGYFLPVPYLARSVEEREAFQAYESVQELMALAEGADLFAVGIGSVNDEGNLASTETISGEELNNLRAAGVVGDIAGSFYGIDGNFIETELGRMTVGLPGQTLRGRRVLGIAAGPSKAAAMLGALRSGVLTEIIIDEHLASAVLSGAMQEQRCQS